MKLIKLQQGETVENLKTYIWLTNEYGVPSLEYIDFFMFNFGRIILIENFKLTIDNYKELDELWNAVVSECKSNNIKYKSTYGNLFYKIISTKAPNKLKEELGEELWKTASEDDKLERLKNLILNFDKYFPEETAALKEETLVVKESDNMGNHIENTNSSSQKSIQHYTLYERQLTRIGKTLNYNGTDIGIISSRTEIKVNNQVFDIGEYINNNNLDTTKIKFGKIITFDTLYRKEDI
jgi:hypothetical protein